MRFLGISTKAELTKREWGKALFLGVFYFCLILLGWPEFIITQYPDLSVFKEWFIIGSFAIVCFVGFCFYGRALKESAKRFLERPVRNLLFVLLFYVGTTILLTLVAQCIGMTTSTNQQAVDSAVHEMHVLISLGTVAILGPIAEELIFRHILIGQLGKQFGTPLMALASLFLFAFIHVSKMEEILLYLPISFIVVTIYLSFKKSIAHAMAFHIVNNFMNVLLIMFR